jgi:hypothetical protein
MDLMFVLLVMGILFYIVFIYLNVQYRIKDEYLIVKCSSKKIKIPIDSILEINETDYYEGSMESIIIGNTKRTDYRFIIMTKDKRYVLTERMTDKMLRHIKAVNPSVRIFVKSMRGIH